ncbi:hypothetical protein ACHAXT_011195 [Thalassiosira profunda]
MNSLLLQQSLFGSRSLGVGDINYANSLAGMMGGAPPLAAQPAPANKPAVPEDPFAKIEPISLAQEPLSLCLLDDKPSLNLHGSLPKLPQATSPIPAPQDPILPTAASKDDHPNWEGQFRALVAYQSEHGHCRVPARCKSNPRLGRWVMTQRRQFTLLAQGAPSALTADRIRRLEDLGFAWSVRAEPTTTWNQKFHELRAYKAAHGDTMVPQRYAENHRLGTWVHTQRRQYKLMRDGKRSGMTEEKVRALNSLGFEWDAKHVGAKNLRWPEESGGEAAGLVPSMIEIEPEPI